MKKLAGSILKQILQTDVHGRAGAFLVLVVVAILYLNSQPDLKVWHAAKLDAEFTAASPVKSFADYLALENRLFAQLDEKVYDRTTVSVPALVKDLFARLPEHGHELVIFDLNRNSEIGPLLKSEPNAFFASLRDDPNRRYRISLLTNASNETNRVIVRRWEPGQPTSTDIDPGLEWPAEIYSLAHVSLPFPGSDPVYGGDNPGMSPGIRLGRIALRGEKGVLEVAAADMLRLRWNPFYPYLERRVMERLELDGP